ncbi:uncharacterized protein LOC143861461 [Tasmannia lanceolata]|uniref:uncharacterized protein LOC143861461 n=1 Tax=Tasmannia lanceolata TaxID=3420 RepID=UPI004063989F
MTRVATSVRDLGLISDTARICDPRSLDSLPDYEYGRPKDEGGLGLTTLSDINLASQLKLLWQIVGKKNSLLFWSDPWHPNGPINSLTSLGTTFNSIPQNSTVEDVMQNGWLERINDEPYLQELKILIKSALFTSGSDRRLFGNPSQMAILNKLPTRDRLAFLSPSDDHSCILCNATPECVDHIFFNCSYTAWIWRSLLWRISNRKKQKKTLLEEEEWIEGKFKHKGQTGILATVLFTASVYFIWMERKNRLHNGIKQHK